MLTTLLIVASSYLLALATWLFYLAVMNLVPVRDQLHPFARVNAYILLAIGLTLDLILNVVVASILFLEPPRLRELLLTARLSRLVKTDSGWRGRLARWICHHLLDQFDPKGKHCR